MSKHITDANKAKLVAFLRSRNAAGEQSLKTWGKQHKLLSHQAEDLADALVADGLATKETRASGYVWRATHVEEHQEHVEEPHPPAPSNEPEESTPAPSNEVEEEEPAPSPPRPPRRGQAVKARDTLSPEALASLRQLVTRLGVERARRATGLSRHTFERARRGQRLQARTREAIREACERGAA